LFYHSLGIDHFASTLSSSDRIQELDLSENDIGPENFMLLLKIFHSNDKILSLNLADCKLDGECVAKLCKILKQRNFSLKFLKFRNSKFSEEGVESIAELIRNHKTLLDLEIFNCGITERGGRVIGDALKTNFNLEKLSIGENILNKKDVEQIQ